MNGIVHCLVVGSPIRHSRSPLIHRLFAEQFGIALRYEKREVQPGELADAITSFRQSGVCGINVTVPLKEEACALATLLSPRARVAGAANVLSFNADGSLEADNTDGLGLVRDLDAHGVALAGRRMLLLGAGGAARGVLPALLGAGAASVTVANRTLARAEALVAALSGLGTLAAAGLDDVFEAPFDLILNATSAGLTSTDGPPVSHSALGASTVCYDLVYGRGEMPFLAWARGCGVTQRIDGLGMLVEQAAAAFERWHGRKPATAPVIEALREQR